MSVYTVEAFLIFEKQFIDGAAYNFKTIESSSHDMSFEVWGIRFARVSHAEDSYEFRHIVNFNKDEGVLECSCKMFTEGVRNKRFKSIVERKCDEVKWRKSKNLSKNNVGSSTAPSQVTLPTFNHLSLVSHGQNRLGEGSFESPSSHLTYYFHSLDSSFVFMLVMMPPVLQQLQSDVIHGNDSHTNKH
ncbi:hypothetical protein Cgig2_009985 [Carnegiea gigantea]|uniref:Uncharacterized protein n=1 Tax=Carnegiea gigantea TaxID=171969 RepID=A0A9Q1JWK1_9CARY|nr:hypothetical protein Cgig2_009985 [Carnegiea gigantea]